MWSNASTSMSNHGCLSSLRTYPSSSVHRRPQNSWVGFITADLFTYCPFCHSLKLNSFPSVDFAKKTVQDGSVKHTRCVRRYCQWTMTSCTCSRCQVLPVGWPICPRCRHATYSFLDSRSERCQASRRRRSSRTQVSFIIVMSSRRTHR